MFFCAEHPPVSLGGSIIQGFTSLHLISSNRPSASQALTACRTIMPGNCGFLLSCNKVTSSLCGDTSGALFATGSVQPQLLSTGSLRKSPRCSKPTAPRPPANLPRDLFIPTSGGGIMIHVFAKTLVWATSYKKFGKVLGWNSLDDELDGCAMLMNNLSQWIDKMYA